VPTFAYQFDDDAAPQQTAPPGAVAPVATYGSELQYLFDMPNVLFPGALDAAQRQLAAGMRAAWASFAASGDPDSPRILWPPFAGQRRERVLSLVTPQPRIATGFSASHHCAFWDEGPARRQAVP
jgi:para-nitrobenzyl esterase